MNLLSLILSILLFVGCQSVPLSQKTTDVGVWEGKVQVSNKTTNHKLWAYVTWASDSSMRRMRVDVRALLDIPIATFLMVGNKTHLWLYRENKYYISDHPKKLFSKLIKFKLNPEIFFSFLGHPRAIGKSWECHRKPKNLKCSHTQESLKVNLDFDSFDHRVIRVKKPQKDFRMRLERTKVEVEDRMFKPLSSSHFDPIQL